MQSLLTVEQKERLTTALFQLAELIIHQDGDIEWLIDLFNGTAGKMEHGEDLIEMGRGRKKVTQVDTSGEISTILEEWNKLQQWLRPAKEREQALRQRIVSELFDGTRLEGSQTVELGGGWRLKAGKDLNLSATNTTGQAVQLLDAVGKLDPALATGLVRWKPEISKTVYNEVAALAETHQDLKPLIAACITVKPAMPELELLPPNEEVVIEGNVAVPQDFGPTITDGSNVEF